MASVEARWLTITDEDIALAVCADKSRCVISRAFRRQYPGTMTLTKVRGIDTAICVTYSTVGNFEIPYLAAKMVAKWDIGGPMYPMSILLKPTNIVI